MAPLRPMFWRPVVTSISPPLAPRVKPRVVVAMLPLYDRMAEVADPRVTAEAALPRLLLPPELSSVLTINVPCQAKTEQEFSCNTTVVSVYPPPRCGGHSGCRIRRRRVRARQLGAVAGVGH